MAISRMLPTLLLASTLLAGCGSNGGGLFNPNPNGAFSISDAASGTAIAGTSIAAPYKINKSGFSINVSEANYAGGAFTAVPTSFTFAGAGFNVPCYIPHFPANYAGVGPFTISFTPDNSAPAGVARVPGVFFPCDFQTVEGVRIADSRGNTTNVVFGN